MIKGLSVGLLGRNPSIAVPSIRRLFPRDSYTPLSFTYKILVGNKQATTPIFTFLPNYPVYKVDFGDGSDLENVVSDVRLNHTYQNSGVYTVSLLGEYQEVFLQKVDLSNEQLIVPESIPILLQLSSFTRLTTIWSLGYGEVGVFRILR